jgi:hypothetical protein
MEKIQNFNIRNIICILFGSDKRNFMGGNINISVLYPFLEQATGKNGICYIFYYGIDKFYILYKFDNTKFNDNLEQPPVITGQTKPEDLPICSILDIKNIYVDINTIKGRKINDAIINLPNSTKNVN